MRKRNKFILFQTKIKHENTLFYYIHKQSYGNENNNRGIIKTVNKVDQ